MTTPTINYLPEWIVLPGGHNLHRSTAVQAACHLLTAHRLLLGDSESATDLAHARLLQLLGDEDGAELGLLAGALIDAATEEA